VQSFRNAEQYSEMPANIGLRLGVPFWRVARLVREPRPNRFRVDIHLDMKKDGPFGPA
jgi:hypothetical protein